MEVTLNQALDALVTPLYGDVVGRPALAAPPNQPGRRSRFLATTNLQRRPAGLTKRGEG